MQDATIQETVAGQIKDSHAKNAQRVVFTKVNPNITRVNGKLQGPLKGK